MNALKRALYLPDLAFNGYRDRDVLDMMKGLLMVAIVIGHNRFLNKNLPDLFAHLYFWHVTGFFFVAALARGFSVASYRITDIAVRYLVPFALFVTAVAAAKMVVTHAPLSAVPWAKALVFGSAPLLEIATSVSLFWFLPTLFSLFAIMILVSRLIAPKPGQTISTRTAAIGTALFLLVLTAAFVVTPMIPAEWMQYFPLGSAICLYLLPLCVAFISVTSLYVGGKTPVKALILLASVAMLVVQHVLITRGNLVNISLYTFSRPNDLSIYVISAVSAIAASVVVFAVSAAFRGVSLIKTIGKRSMHIFLFHHFIQTPTAIVLAKLMGATNTLVAVVAGLAVSAFAIAVSIAISLALDRFPHLRTLVFPKDLAAFISALGLGGKAAKPA